MMIINEVKVFTLYTLHSSGLFFFKCLSMSYSLHRKINILITVVQMVSTRVIELMNSSKEEKKAVENNTSVNIHV